MLAVLHFLPSRAVLLCGLTWLWTFSFIAEFLHEEWGTALAPGAWAHDKDVSVWSKGCSLFLNWC